MKKIFAFLVALSPLSAFAQSSGTVTGAVNTVDDIFTRFTSLSNSFIVILISAAVVYIIFNTIRYLIAGSEDDRKKGGYSIMYGVIALFVIISIWGLVYILKRTFITNDKTVQNTDIPKAIPLNQ